MTEQQNSKPPNVQISASDGSSHDQTDAPNTAAQEGLQDMPLTAHLIELRTRLLHGFVAVLTAFICLAYFSRDIYTWLSQPLTQHLPTGATMIATDVTSPFMAPIKLTLFAAFAIAMPYVLHQVWQFVAPALYKKEKRVALPILLSSIVLFYTGMAFAFYLVLPGVLKFLVLFSPETVVPMTDINSYLSFVVKLIFVFGITFEIPIAVLLLVLVGAISVDTLAEKRRYIIVACFAVAAVVTPPDGLSMIMLAVPMWLLFELGLLSARALVRQEKQGVK